MKLLRVRLALLTGALAVAAMFGFANVGAAASYCPADVRATQPTGCCPWQYRSGNQCIDRPDMSQHDPGYQMQQWQRCWRLTTCSCRGRQQPAGGGQCAPCAFTGVRLYCIRRS